MNSARNYSFLETVAQSVRATNGCSISNNNNWYAIFHSGNSVVQRSRRLINQLFSTFEIISYILLVDYRDYQLLVKLFSKHCFGLMLKITCRDN